MRLKWDWLLFALILAVGSISLLIIYSINKNLALTQFIYWITGLLIFYVFSKTDFRNWQNISVGFYVITIVFLILLFVIGEPVRGSIRWINFGIFRFQPSELAKASGIFVLSTFYLTRSAKDFKNILISLLLFLPVIVLVFIQPDIGSTLAFFAIWLGISITAGLKPKYLLAFALIGILAISLFYELLAPYQKERLSSFINPAKDPLGTGYNIIQSKIAVGSGKFWGKGFAQGSQSQLNFLPEAESDFIFASVAEQLGLVGSSLLLIFFTWLIMRIIGIAKEKNRFGQLIISGIASLLIIQFLVNVGMNIGLLPVTGITFPLVSYGGSSLITTLFLLGVAFSINRKP